MKLTLLSIFASVILLSCEKNQEDDATKNTQALFEGIWVNSKFIDTVYTMTRSTEFVDTTDGFKFNHDGSFVQRANSGECGTPPIVYANYNGTWTKFPDNALFIETEYWGGVISYKIVIVELTSTKLVYKLVYDSN